MPDLQRRASNVRRFPSGVRVGAIAAVIVGMLGLTSCLRPATTFGRCRGNGFATDAGWLVQCRSGRWIRGGVSVQQALELVDIARRPAPEMQGPPIRVMVAGDSTANVWGAALARYSNRFPHIIQVKDVAWPGCPITPTTGMRNLPDERMASAHCSSWQTWLAEDLATFRPDVTIVVESMMEQADQMPEDDSGWRNVLDPAWAAYQLASYHRFADTISASGSAILWADVPVMRFALRTMPWLSDAPERTAALNANFARLAAERTDVGILPLAVRFDRPFGAIDWFARPDGVHFSDAATDIETANWLIPFLIERFRPTAPEPTPG